jgi:hypothetical protein
MQTLFGRLVATFNLFGLNRKDIPFGASLPCLDLGLDKQMPKNINFGLWKK